MKALLLIFFLVGTHQFSSAQSNDKGNIHLHFGAVVVYSTYSVGYESFDLLKNSTKHQIRPFVRIGGWNASIFNKNNGSLGTIGASYLFGRKNHFLEHSSAFVAHFDRGLKGKPITFIGGLYRPYLGYRYQPSEKKVIFKIGTGWREVVQVGFGYRL